MSHAASRLRTPLLVLGLLTVLVAGGLTLTAAFGPARASGQNLSQLQDELGATQTREHGLQASLAQVQQEIAGLTGQIGLVQSREQAVRAALAADETKLAAARVAVGREEARLAVLEARLARARVILAHQLVSGYENAQPDLVSVVLSAGGFDQLLEELSFLSDAEHQQQTIIGITRTAKAEAQEAAARLTRLQDADARVTQERATEANALAGMNALLQSRQAALGHARAAQQTALAAVRAHGARVQAAIAQVQAEQAAAARSAVTSAAGPALGATDGWAIPYAIVLCESGGQNLPPNSAGASGYYQIIPSTWRLYGGTGSAAYLASKAEQSAVAARIWDNGAGASNWVCSGIVGIH